MSQDPLDKPELEHELLREFAHEIRTPLTAMIGYTSFLRKSDKVKLSEEQAQDYAQRLHASTKRLLEITERVLDEAVRGEPRVIKQKFKFEPFADELLQTFEGLALERGVELVLDVSKKFPTLVTDPVLLYEMMTNLIANALKFTPRGGKVKIKGEVDIHNEGIILVIQDTGKGIPASILMRMMQVEDAPNLSSTSEQRCWGQGVHLVRQKAKLLGGRLEIENAPQGGTVACIRLPKD
ncbi:HAMP domain-containing sensor histidine kinase [Magnetovibrio sp. PR-2]|uniref:sensor histidine kinase n=1 Tax=Magnetovibrio sp. PR-2 TaxID=3120356 RepID=UPI002FCE427A